MISRSLRLALATSVAAVIAPAQIVESLPNTLTGGAPLVLGHRGASGYRPEHTLEAYDLAIMLGANFIEPDLVPTKDGRLVARHENAISILRADGTVQEATTNVNELPQFADRKKTKTIDGVTVTGWFTEDFTLVELKTLRARERIPANRPANTTYNDRYEIPTLEEVIDLAKAKTQQLGRTIGVYPETKHPSYFQGIGLPMETTLVTILHAAYGNTKSAPVYIQSFEVANLQEIRTKTTMKIVQLFGGSGAPWDFVAKNDARTYATLTTPTGLAFIRTYADGIGPFKYQVIPRKADNTLDRPTTLVADAHAVNLTVHPYTFRAENSFLPREFQVGSSPNALGDMAGEIRAYLEAGIDGFFTDQSDLGALAVSARRAHRLTNISVRALVTAEKTLIAGLVVAEGKRSFLIRASGRSLGNFGVGGVLADPRIAIYSGTVKLGENDTWQPALAGVFTRVGAFPFAAGSNEAAMTAVLPAGAYTVHLTTGDGTPGESLFEVFELP